MDAAHFAGRLKELREAAGLTQKELAEKIGTSVRNVSRLETGAQEATWPTVIALCQALNATCDAFLQPPAVEVEPHRGRPPQAREQAAEPAPKRPRGRPRKIH
jgi:transcriptional regulator with XRE-family HTH domain